MKRKCMTPAQALEQAEVLRLSLEKLPAQVQVKYAAIGEYGSGPRVYIALECGIKDAAAVFGDPELRTINAGNPAVYFEADGVRVTMDL